jgi:hypothetical protein
VLPQEQASLESALASYRSGQGPQRAVLETVVALLDDRTDYLRLLTAHALETSRLEEASLTSTGGLEGLLMHGRTGLGGAMGMDPGGPRSTLGPMSTSSEMR